MAGLPAILFSNPATAVMAGYGRLGTFVGYTVIFCFLTADSLKFHAEAT
jgi:hypothetical protein